MRRFGMGLAAVIAIAAGAGGLAVAQSPAAAGFLDANYLNLVDVILPAPVASEPRAVADREIFKLTRALKGSDRWRMAVNDGAGDTASLMRNFACATRINMTPANAPKTAALLEKASRDAERETDELKKFYKKRRPFLFDQGETCEPQAGLEVNWDYPSGSATRGWAWALILSEILDDRAAPIMARGRAYGESRIVCGMHNFSAVEAAWTVAASTLAVVRTEPAYQAGIAAARAELRVLAKVGAPPSAQTCSSEEITVSQPVLR